MKLQSSLGQFSQENGFTLIEMLIVVAIIGILVAIAIPALNTAKSDAQDAKAAAVISSIETAKARYALKDGAPEGGPANLAQFSNLMLVNGAQPTADANLITGTKFGNINYGNYPTGEGQDLPAKFNP